MTNVRVSMPCYIWTRSAGQSATTSKNPGATPETRAPSNPSLKKNPSFTQRDETKEKSKALHCIKPAELSLLFHSVAISRNGARLAAVASAGSGSSRAVPLSRRFKRRPVLLPHARPRPLFSYLSLCGRFFNPFSG